MDKFGNWFLDTKRIIAAEQGRPQFGVTAHPYIRLYLADAPAVIVINEYDPGYQELHNLLWGPTAKEVAAYERETAT